MIARLRKALRLQLLPLVLGFAVLAGLVGFRSWLIEDQRAVNESLHQAFELQRQLLGVQTLIQDAETGQRGYLLTGESEYLLPYETALASLPSALDTLRINSAGAPDRLKRIESLQSLTNDKLTELQQTIDLHRNGRAAEALQVVRDDRGRFLMDSIRNTIAELQSTQAARMQARLADAERIDGLLRFGSVAALAGVLALGVYGVLNARRRLDDVVAANNSLVEANRFLKQEKATRETAEQQVRQMQKMEAIGQLTGGIAHDFNNMLAVILSAMNLMQRKLSRGESDVHSLVEAATDATSRAANLTARLLAFARQQPLAPQVVDANRMVTGMSDLLRRTLGESIQVETVLAGGLWRTHADPSQLENAIVNLAVNGRDAMAEGGKLTIETGNCHLDDHYAAQHAEVPAGQYVLIAVSDTGIGMPPEVIARAFDPFFTTKPASKGTGLGLSQVFGFVKQSGGHVKIYSEPGEGTTVKIYLPRHFGEDSRDNDAAIRPLFSSRPTETVLVVEDDERVRNGTVAMLRELGYTVAHAGNAAEALSKLGADPGIALLFTDIVMPVTNGRKLAEEAVRQRPALKVLFTTGFTKNAVVHNGVLDHGVNFLAKPFTIDQLGVKLRQVLDA